MKDAGLTVDKALTAIGDGLEATSDKGVPNHGVRLRSADMILKLAGAYPRDKEISHDRDHRHLHIHQTVMKELSELPYDELVALIHREALMGELEKDTNERDPMQVIRDAVIRDAVEHDRE